MQTASPSTVRIAVVRALTIGFFFLTWPMLWASDFESANDLFDRGKFAEAKQIYEKLVEGGEGSANLFYNLGNADYRLGSAGRAMLNYERALALNPRHPEARANLNLLRNQTGAKVSPVSKSERIFSTQPTNFWIVAAVSGAWLVLFGGAGLVTRPATPKFGFWIAFIVGFAVSATGSVGVWLGVKEEAVGIVTAKQVEARLAPAESAGLADALPAGSRVHMLSERGTWIYCELPGAGRGWIPHEALERVRPRSS